MKLIFQSLLAAGLCATLFAADEKPAAQFKDARDKQSYALGINVGTSMKNQGADINVDEVMNGLRDFMAGKAKLDEKELREVMMAWQTELRNKQMEKRKAENEVNKKTGDAFLAANAQKPGVKTMPDGLQYKVLVPGKGPQPKAGDRVSAHYRGTLIDGTQFDSSYERGQPLVTSTLGGVIPGWLEALTNMHVGDKWEVTVPNQLAYGEQARGKIPAGAVLIFELELLGIEPPQTNASPAFPSLNQGPGATPQIRVQQPPGAGGPQRVPLRPAPDAGKQPQIQVQPAPGGQQQIQVQPAK